MEGPRRLLSDDKTLNFDCEKPSLNEFLIKYAYLNQQSRSAVTYVVTENSEVVAYYSLASGAVKRADATDRVLKGLASHDEVPVILLARLAVDKDSKGKGLGKGLLKDAFKRSLNLAEELGSRAILVHALDEEAKGFYLNYEFEPSPTDPFQLLCLMKDVKHSIGNPVAGQARILTPEKQY